MGFYTHYKLEINDVDGSIEDWECDEHAEEIAARTKGYGWVFHNDWDRDSFSDDNAVKWYDHVQHMKSYSRLKRNKGLLFIVHGLEENDTRWLKYFRDGKLLQVCKGMVKTTIEYEPFTEGEPD